MLKINLLPEAARKDALSSIEQLHRTPLLWAIGGVMVALVFAYTIPIMLHQKELQRLNAKIQLLQPKKAEVDQLQQFLQHLRAQEVAFRQLSNGQGLWAKRLNTLSNVTPEGVWFTDLTLDEAKGLVIQGAAIGQGGAEMVSVGRIVADLKADPEFASAVKDIQIESIKRTQDKDIELVQFTLTCLLIPRPSS